MAPLRLALCLALSTGCVCAQSRGALEIRGTVVEGSLGIGGVTVTLYEFGHTPPEATTRSVFAVTFTDATGKFTFHPALAGEYYVEVKKEGYFAESFGGPTVEPVDSTGEAVTLDVDHPLRERTLPLMRLGEVRAALSMKTAIQFRTWRPWFRPPRPRALPGSPQPPPIRTGTLPQPN